MTENSIASLRFLPLNTESGMRAETSAVSNVPREALECPVYFMTAKFSLCFFPKQSGPEILPLDKQVLSVCQ